MMIRFLLVLIMSWGCIANGLAEHLSTHHLPNNFVLTMDKFIDQTSKTLIFQNTISPSGKYIFALTSKGENQYLHLLSVKTLRDVVSPIPCNDEFCESEARFITTALWNASESRVALQSGGRTWSEAYVFTIQEEKLTEIQVPSDAVNLEAIRNSVGPVKGHTRLYLNCSSYRHSKWINNKSLIVGYDGTAKLVDDGYKDFDFALIWKIQADDKIQIIQAL